MHKIFMGKKWRTGRTIYRQKYNIKMHFREMRSRDSAVGIATGYGLDDRGVGVRVPTESRIFSTSSRPVLEPNQPSNGYRGLFPLEKNGWA
jgi:hypothetical protein